MVIYKILLNEIVLFIQRRDLRSISERTDTFLASTQLDEIKYFCFSDNTFSYLCRFESVLFHRLLTGNSVNEQCLGGKSVIYLMLININILADNR